MIKLFFGSPGCGKSSLASRMMYYSDAPFIYSNFDNDLSIKIKSDMIGRFAFPDYSELYIDEAGIDYNNRNYKNLPQNAIEYFKLHRHFKNDIYLFSQSWEDTDITLRRLTDELWYMVKKGPFTVCRKLRKSVKVNKESEQIIDGYKFAGILWNLLPPPLHEKTLFIFFRKPYFKYFDSYFKPAKFHPLPPMYLEMPKPSE